MPARSLSAERLTELYAQMLLIRRVEETLSSHFAAGDIPGFIHLSIGQEATAAGVMSALRDDDTIASNHRGHGHSLAKGMQLDGFFAELFGRADGLCKGRGGSMHVADLSVGMLGANGIVGAGVPLSVGSALAHKTLGTDRVCAAFFGDGALAEGAMHESLNIAALWSLPLLFVCENNGWSEFSPSDTQFAGTAPDLAGAFGIEAQTVDGNDVEAVAQAAQALVAEMRKGGGPRLLECKTTRVHGHFEGDPQRYRNPDEIEGLSARDPIARAAAMLKKRKVAQKTLEKIAGDVDARIARAVEGALASPLPDFAEAAADVYADPLNGDAAHG
ncbi:thiamine pyrophosphate-dependent dehydrogenase E1 component subunit alpha [Futiania mangrovi]|uniref:Thiamine pyrophosphate-dependent dehydrogenase E1 component subunit alpha n=1 Tax=Futiania mangrovi TaxID=2959716 RepID=A0A9J6PAW0_9PROT|nr:thiamine pyrophosphate-dependent dehydrogenase E1 component subunit alpha [Futiania mangrovii]MCP1337244.1 thiamine pyrophosphate-dependent dehydrogenase E1 component subunit alpha [Futiania mangrovii]